MLKGALVGAAVRDDTTSNKPTSSGKNSILHTGTEREREGARERCVLVLLPLFLLLFFFGDSVARIRPFSS